MIVVVTPLLGVGRREVYTDATGIVETPASAGDPARVWVERMYGEPTVEVNPDRQAIEIISVSPPS